MSEHQIYVNLNFTWQFASYSRDKTEIASRIEDAVQLVKGNEE